MRVIFCPNHLSRAEPRYRQPLRNVSSSNFRETILKAVVVATVVVVAAVVVFPETRVFFFERPRRRAILSAARKKADAVVEIQKRLCSRDWARRAMWRKKKRTRRACPYSWPTPSSGIRLRRRPRKE